MSAEDKNSLVIASVYLWIGFVGAISFMEAWLKFRAPGVNVQTGLSIGRLVFNALNKVEWVFALVIYANLISLGKLVFGPDNWFYYIPCLLLFVQTFWILPELDVRAAIRIKGINTPPSSLHILYIIMEVVKVASLLIYGFKQFK